MNDELQNLLHRWHEGSLTTDEMRTLTALLAKPEARQSLRRDWFLESALPEALAAVHGGLSWHYWCYRWWSRWWTLRWL